MTYQPRTIHERIACDLLRDIHRTAMQVDVIKINLDWRNGHFLRVMCRLAPFPFTHTRKIYKFNCSEPKQTRQPNICFSFQHISVELFYFLFAFVKCNELAAYIVCHITALSLWSERNDTRTHYTHKMDIIDTKSNATNGRKANKKNVKCVICRCLQQIYNFHRIQRNTVEMNHK